MTSCETSSREKLPELKDILLDSPSFHQNLFSWKLYVDKLESKVTNLVNNFELYKNACKVQIEMGQKICQSFQDIKDVFNLPEDKPTIQSLDKFSDCLSKIFSYQDTLCIQTSYMLIEKFQTILDEASSLKSLFRNVITQYHNYQLSMDKLYDSPSYEASPDPASVDKLAVKSIESRSIYQNDIITYVALLRNFVTNKKREIMLKLLEFMFVNFSFSNYSRSTLNDNEDLMNKMFDTLSNEMKNNEVLIKNDGKNVIELISIMEKTNADDILQFPLVNDRSIISNQANLSVVSTGSQWIKNKVSDYLVYRADRKLVQNMNKVFLDNDQTRTVKKDNLNQDKVLLPSDLSLSTENLSQLSSCNYGSILHLASNCLRVVPQLDLVSQEHLDSFPNTDYLFDKKGYLRLKMQSNLLNSIKFQSLFFGIDCSKGLILAQGIDQISMIPFISLTTATVKESYPVETDRNFCFQIITPKGNCYLQAFNRRDRSEWVTAIQCGIMSSLKHVQLSQSSVSSDTNYHEHDSKSKNWWLSVEGNNLCADCNSIDPEWASLNIGVIICIECSGVHRSLGVQVSKVRSLNLDQWDEKMKSSFLSKGNIAVNSIFEAKLPSNQKPISTSTFEERNSFIRSKYIDKNFSKSKSKASKSSKSSISTT